MQTETNRKTKEALHYGIAERGKLYALEGNYPEALRHYREAIRLTTTENSPEIFYQHYSQCVMEALEQNGNYRDVINYCRKTLDFITGHTAESEFSRKYCATLFERMAVQHLLLGESQEAKEALKEVDTLADIKAMPFALELRSWVLRGFTVNAQQVKNLQKKHNYFTVIRDTVQPEMAIDLPEAMKII